MKPMAQSQTLIRPARSAVSHGKLEKQQQLKRGDTVLISSEVRSTKTAATSCLQLLSSLASPHKSPAAMAPMAPERLLHASTGHHDATRSRLVRIYIFIQIVTFPIHPFFAFVERVIQL
jgi:hypothetical protein